MREFQGKKTYTYYLYSWPAIIALIVLVLFFSKATWNVYQKEKASAANAIHAQEELLKLQNRQEMLSGELGRLETDQGIEEEIRAKYNVSKPGEEIVIIVDKNAATGTPTQKKESWWDKFKGLFR